MESQSVAVEETKPCDGTSNLRCTEQIPKYPRWKSRCIHCYKAHKLATQGIVKLNKNGKPRKRYSEGCLFD